MFTSISEGGIFNSSITLQQFAGGCKSLKRFNAESQSRKERRTDQQERHKQTIGLKASEEELIPK
jgi:hypothetical protein